jgi:hypothetical protein
MGVLLCKSAMTDAPAGVGNWRIADIPRLLAAPGIASPVHVLGA